MGCEMSRQADAYSDDPTVKPRCRHRGGTNAGVYTGMGHVSGGGSDWAGGNGHYGGGFFGGGGGDGGGGSGCGEGDSSGGGRVSSWQEEQDEGWVLRKVALNARIAPGKVWSVCVALNTCIPMTSLAQDGIVTEIFEAERKSRG
jgi:hypothetical protein